MFLGNIKNQFKISLAKMCLTYHGGNHQSANYGRDNTSAMKTRGESFNMYIQGGVGARRCRRPQVGGEGIGTQLHAGRVTP